MNTKDIQSLDFNSFKQGKFKQFNNQKKTIFNFLKNHTATASMISYATGIPQKSICRYKRDLEKKGLLFELEKRLCKITGFRAWYLTTNLETYQKFNQSKKVK